MTTKEGTKPDTAHSTPTTATSNSRVVPLAELLLRLHEQLPFEPQATVLFQQLHICLDQAVTLLALKHQLPLHRLIRRYSRLGRRVQVRFGSLQQLPARALQGP